MDETAGFNAKLFMNMFLALSISNWYENYYENAPFSFLPVDMKKGMRNLPERTRSLNAGSVDASNGRAPQTKTYNTTPSDYKR